jgi:hypothetical protein
MRALVAELTLVLVIAVALTIGLGLSVMRAPSDRVFGMPIVGRQHDPFTVMAGFGRPLAGAANVYAQPVTDITGALVARRTGPVAAYNWLVLVTFPLSALAAYALARYLQLPPAIAGMAALFFAFSPFHLAQAAYHPHIAQTQWMPLYLLALWRCLDRATWRASLLLVAASIGVTLSNFYGGLIAAVITPVAAVAWWWFRGRRHPRAAGHLAMTLGVLAAVAGGALLCAWMAVPDVISQRAAFAFPLADVKQYSARWWSYVVPPVAHPILGRGSLLFWHDARLGAGLVEQQVSVGWSVMALSLVAIIGWFRGWVQGRFRWSDSGPIGAVPVLAVVAGVAFWCSVSPPLWLYDLAPMFRTYARFGVVVQLMAVLAAGLGAEWLWRSGRRGARVAAAALGVAAAFEYAVSPGAMSRDVLPTDAHRWVMDAPGRIYALDCSGATPESESIPWLSRGRIAVAHGNADDCMQPRLSDALAADGYSHVIVRRHSSEGRWFAGRGTPDGLTMAAWFDTATVFAVSPAEAHVFTARMTGFSPRETDDTSTWRWMGREASWTVVNASADVQAAVVDVELSAFQHARPLVILLDGQQVQSLTVEAEKRLVRLGPFILTPGAHAMTFQPVDPPAAPGDWHHDGDTRALSFAVGEWQWDVKGGRP